MRTAVLLLFGAAAVAGLVSDSPAAEIEFEYQVWAADVPTHMVLVHKPGVYGILDSVHWSLADALDAEAALEADGYTASVRLFRPSKSWLYDNSEFFQTFDNYDDAVDYADMVENKTGLFAWIKTVEVIPGGP